MPIQIDEYSLEIYPADKGYELDVWSGNDMIMIIPINVDKNFDLSTLHATLRTMYDGGMTWQDIKDYYEL